MAGTRAAPALADVLAHAGNAPLADPALVKVGTPSWRVVRYGSGSTRYRPAGPPPLRMLGPSQPAPPRR